MDDPLEYPADLDWGRMGDRVQQALDNAPQERHGRNRQYRDKSKNECVLREALSSPAAKT